MAGDWREPDAHPRGQMGAWRVGHPAPHPSVWTQASSGQSGGLEEDRGSSAGCHEASPFLVAVGRGERERRISEIIQK